MTSCGGNSSENTIDSSEYILFKSSTHSIDEDGGSIRIYVSRTGGSSGVASVDFTASNGTALEGLDYISSTGQLTWSDGDSADKYFDVSIVNDSTPEISETFSASLRNVSGASLGSPSSTVVTINGPNDQPAQNCDGGVHGESQQRVRYEAPTVAHDQNCVSETQSRTCTDGIWSAWSGTYAYESCVQLGICIPPITEAGTYGATVIGTGTPGSCSEAAFDAAVNDPQTSAITFDCGSTPHTMVLTSKKVIDRDLIIDGGGLITLSGNNSSRILELDGIFDQTTPLLTVQNLSFINGFTGDLPGSSVTSGGAAILRNGGTLHVINCSFTNNVGPASGQDVAGGAIYSVGVGPTIIVESTFSGNQCSNGGAIGNLRNDFQLVNSTVESNHATGTGGNTGNGGNGGGVYMDGTGQTASLCGVQVDNNQANAHGGGVFRVSNNGIGSMLVDRSSVSGNTVSADSSAGGLYLQGLQTTILDSTVANNSADAAGGMLVWTNSGTQTLDMTNVTIAGNLAREGLGGGLMVAAGITGALHHVTIAANAATGATGFAAAISDGRDLILSNSVIADNTKVFAWENTSCSQSAANGGGNYQWPEFNEGGQSELGCTTDITFGDPNLGTLQDNGGPTPTIAPAAGSLVILAVDNCAATDQRGQPRSSPCTAGAMEP
jgi:hypothetical protein